MEFDRTRWFCSWNNDQNCTKLCQGHLLYMSPLAFWRQLSRILGQSEVNDNRTFDYLIDRLPILWLLYLFMANLPINSHFNSSQIRIWGKFLIFKYLVPRPSISLSYAPAKSIFTFFSRQNLDTKVSLLYLLLWGKVMVPTRTRKPGKWEGIFQSGKSQGILNRLEKSEEIVQSTGKLRELQTNVIYYF